MIADVVDRIERFLLSLPTNPYPLSVDEKQQMYRLLRRIKQKPERPGMSVASQVGMIVAWVVGPQMARQIGLDAMQANALDEGEREQYNLGIVAATFFPPPIGTAPPPLTELMRRAEEFIGLPKPQRKPERTRLPWRYSMPPGPVKLIKPVQ